MEHPNLFLSFARLAEQERIVETALEWIQQYGILGCGQGYYATTDGIDTINPIPYESVEDFFSEVDRATTILRLYECVLNKDAKAVRELVNDEEDSLVREWWDEYWDEEEEDEYHGGPLGFALDAVIGVTNQVKAAFAYQELERPARQADPATVEERWFFRNLLGAMYLQMYWLLAAGERNVTRCDNCGKLISLIAEVPSVKDPSNSRLQRG